MVAASQGVDSVEWAVSVRWTTVADRCGLQRGPRLEGPRRRGGRPPSKEMEQRGQAAATSGEGGKPVADAEREEAAMAARTSEDGGGAIERQEDTTMRIEEE